ncbi:hypothetical protein EVAR_60959_1 [Eumeta japonica]|uniref:Uncharacterized protein n=1 Tax=Eumeta variegata TaxID=151549 RepID=A0A4C1XV87_EUMVA|nr:hypothetical protein EVAR_60959_1 [Eumeta japonica]
MQGGARAGPGRCGRGGASRRIRCGRTLKIIEPTAGVHGSKSKFQIRFRTPRGGTIARGCGNFFSRSLAEKGGPRARMEHLPLDGGRSVALLIESRETEVGGRNAARPSAGVRSSKVWRRERAERHEQTTRCPSAEELILDERLDAYVSAARRGVPSGPFTPGEIRNRRRSKIELRILKYSSRNRSGFRAKFNSTLFSETVLSLHSLADKFIPLRTSSLIGDRAIPAARVGDGATRKLLSNAAGQRSPAKKPAARDRGSSRRRRRPPGR